MSGNDNTNWDDHLDFESLADEHDAELGISESGEGSSDLTDLSYDSEPVSRKASHGRRATDQAPGREQGVPGKPVAKSAPGSGKPKRSRLAYKRRSGLPAVIMGFLFGFSAVVSGLGVGGAVLLVSGLDIKALWNPAALLQVEPWLDLQNHPLNVLYLVGLGIVLLTVLILWRILSFSRNANRNLRETEELLGKLITLRLDNEAAWQSPLFKKDQAVESFVFEILGAWRLQAARQDKNLALEGELRRLEQAVAAHSRDEITLGFDHPMVGRLADHLARWYDEKEAAAQEVQAVRAKDQHQSGTIIGVIQDARSWSRHTLDQLGVQGAAVERIARNLAETAEAAAPAQEGSSRMAQISLTLRELRTQLENLATSTANAPGSDHSGVPAHFTDLVDRGGKLAFQIAMEVANLGARGERLLPMAQALEELTTEFRESSGQFTEAASSSGSFDPRVFQDMARKIDGLIGLLDSVPAEPRPALWSRSQDLAQVADKISAELGNIAGSFNHQTERLTNLGVSFAALTGTSFDPEDLAVGKPDNPPNGTLEISQMDPFAKGPETPRVVEDIDPFSTGELVLPVNEEPTRESDFSFDVTPGLETFKFSTSNEPEPAEDPPALSIANSMPEGLLVQPVAADPGLSSEKERVYDLAEFGAVPVSDSPLGAEPAERIYDLAEFGAVGLD